MKIYITNIPPSTIKLAAIDKYRISKEGYKKYELVSQEFGTHIIEKEKMYRIEPTFNMDLHLINPVISQLPVDYILTKMICFEYVINSNASKKNSVKLVVECIEECNETLDKEMVPINFYFSLNYSSNLVDDNLLEEINVFLLELN